MPAEPRPDLPPLTDFIDALRAVIGKQPLYAEAQARRQDKERSKESC